MKGEIMGRHKFDRRSYINAAKDLHYPESVIRKLKEATSERECDKIMTNARKDAY